MMRNELFFRPPHAFAKAVLVTPIAPRRHGSPSHQLVVMHSRKNTCRLRLEPLLLDFCLMLERRRDVTCYQPTPYRLAHPARHILYTPSVCAYGPDLGLVFFDVQRLSFPTHTAHCDHLAEWFDEMGYLFYPHVIGQRDGDGTARQYRYLYHSSFGSQPGTLNAALTLLRTLGATTLQGLLDAGAGFCDVAELLFTGAACADLRFPLLRTTRVSLAGGGNAQ